MRHNGLERLRGRETRMEGFLSRRVIRIVKAFLVLLVFVMGFVQTGAALADAGHDHPSEVKKGQEVAQPSGEVHRPEGHSVEEAPRGAAHADEHSEGDAGIHLSPEARKNIGMKTERVAFGTLEKVLLINGIVKPEPNRIANVSPQVAGMVEMIYVGPGDRVAKGDRLLDIRSLQYGNPPPLITLYSPISGFVFQWHVNVGEYVDPAKVLFGIVDPSVVWIEGDVPEEYAGHVKEGQEVRIRAMSYPERLFHGRIVKSSAVVEPEKRVVHRWAAVENPRLELKPEMFTDMTVVVGTSGRSLKVPKGAVLRQGVETFVYIEKGDAYLKRFVEVGMQDDRSVQIRKGLSPGEVVVTQGGYELMSSIVLKGAGGHEH